MSPKHQQAKINKIQSCDWSITELPGLSPQEQSQLLSCGITTTAILIAQANHPAARVALSNKLKVNINHVNKWVALADLARIPSVGTQYCGLLLHAGIASVAQLVNVPTHRLHKQILRLQVATMQRRDLCPTVELVQQWIQQAQIIGS
ncbi:MAG: DUF4332 domain-containing protein [Calothrix sp. MO_192.B10]|nr:DUF4332 domain-containing protein [Calothrix sp. MO_192.B10]